MPIRKQFKTKEEYNAWFKKYRAKNAEKLRKYNREYNKAWRKKNGYHNEKSWEKRNWDKILVENKLNYYVRTGKIKREPCQKCGEEKTHGHHPDYSEPLKVVWLCPLCHKKVHKK